MHEIPSKLGFRGYKKQDARLFIVSLDIFRSLCIRYGGHNKAFRDLH